VNRVGLGFDAHRFDPDRPLVLGGVSIPDAPGLRGHSDADVVSHAVADALLGAARLGDLGVHFPATERWRGASGLDILRSASQLVAGDGWIVANVAVTVVCEQPRLGPWRGRMEARTAEALGLDDGAVSIAATTTDGMGFTGRSEGAAAIAVVLLESASVDDRASERGRRSPLGRGEGE
jgi:2-C-methyl-D-erythritol 2,4-cyclodiphosphate synthase